MSAGQFLLGAAAAGVGNIFVQQEALRGRGVGRYAAAGATGAGLWTFSQVRRQGERAADAAFDAVTEGARKKAKQSFDQALRSFTDFSPNKRLRGYRPIKKRGGQRGAIMPYYKKRSYGRRGGFKKRRSFRKKKESIPYAIPTPTKAVKFEYFTSASVTPGQNEVLGTPNYLAVNDVYTGDNQNATLQPAGIDQWAAFYKNAMVVWSKIDIVGTVNDSTDCEVLFGVTRISSNQFGGNVPTAGDALREWVLDKNTKVAAVSGTHDQLRLSMSTNVRKLEGVRDLMDNKSDYNTNIQTAANGGAAPSKKGYYYLWASSNDTTVPVIHCWVKMTYIVILNNPIYPTVSVTTT